MFEEPGWSEIRVGGVTAATHLGGDGAYLAPFCIDAVIPVGFEVEHGVVLFSLALLAPDNSAILLIDRNELIFRRDQLWDITVTGSSLTVRSGPGRIRLSCSFSTATRKIRVGVADFWVNGLNVRASSDVLSINGQQVPLRNVTIDAPIAIAIGDHVEEAMAGFKMESPFRDTTKWPEEVRIRESLRLLGRG